MMLCPSWLCLLCIFAGLGASALDPQFSPLDTTKALDSGPELEGVPPPFNTDPEAPPNKGQSSDVSRRIIDGTEVIGNRYSYAASLFLPYNSNLPKLSPYCGASRIYRAVLLTAAHCVDWIWTYPQFVGGTGGSSELFRVTIGNRNAALLNAASSDQGFRGYPVRKIVIHPGWNPNTLANDIALIYLKTCPPVDDAAAQVIEPSRWDPDTDWFGNPDLNGWYSLNKTLAIIGWGQTSDAVSGMVNTQRYGHVQRRPDEELTQLFGNTFLPTTSFGAGGPRDDGGIVQNSCYGDSGGPVIFNLQDKDNPTAGPQFKDRQVGIVSYGDAASCAEYSEVYTRVSAYSEWIKEQNEQNGPFTCQAPLAPRNDVPEYARWIACPGTPGEKEDAAGVYYNSDASDNKPDHLGTSAKCWPNFAGHKGVWYKTYIHGGITGKTIRISTCKSNFDTVMRTFTIPPGTTLDPTNLGDCTSLNDDGAGSGCNPFTSAVEFVAGPKGTWVYVLVTSYYKNRFNGYGEVRLSCRVS